MRDRARLRSEFVQFLSSVKLTDRRALIACLSIGFFVRLIPELLAFPLPIGFDTIHYAAAMKSGVIWAHWSTFFTSSWLLYALIVPLYALIPTDPFLLLKIVAPLLYGLNVAGIYWFSRKMLGWDLRMGLLAGGFFALQLASLRISWDLLRNILGLGILLFTLPHIKEVNTKRGFALFVSLSLLTVFAHEYAAVTLLVVVIGLVAMRLFKEGIDLGSKRLVLAVLPALTVFVFKVFLTSFPVSNVTQTNIIEAGDAVITRPGGVFFLVDYLSIHSSVEYYASYWSLALSVGVLFAVLYLPYLFLVVKGFFKDRILGIWTGFLCIGAFGCLIFPFSALEYWHRWMFMLVYPLTFYAVYGFKILKNKLSANAKHHFSSWLSNKKPAAMIVLTFSIGIAYLASPMWLSYTNGAYANDSVSSVSSISLYFSASPTVPYEDVDGLRQSMNWLNENLDANSCVVLQHAFFRWGELYLDKSHAIVHFTNDIDLAVSTAISNSFNHMFFVWWNEPIGWYGISVPESFFRVQDFGRISVYMYEGVNFVGS
jgi:hypothetical protein